MMTPTKRFLAALPAALLAAGCLGGGSAATRFYILAPGETTPVPAAGAMPLGVLSVGIGPVSVPGYLDRPQIVTRPAPDRIELGEFDQWGEPLGVGVARVLAENLAREMPSARVASFPWRSAVTVKYQVIVDLTRLDGPAGGDLVLEGRWRVLDGRGKGIELKTSRVTEPTGGPGYSAMVAALSRALVALSRDIAQGLAALPQ